MMIICETLYYIIKGGKVLLLKKAKELWGEGKWNASGSKLLPNEDSKQGASREAWKETGLRVKSIEQGGILNFCFGNKLKLIGSVMCSLRILFQGSLDLAVKGSYNGAKSNI